MSVPVRTGRSESVIDNTPFAEEVDPEGDEIPTLKPNDTADLVPRGLSALRGNEPVEAELEAAPEPAAVGLLHHTPPQSSAARPAAAIEMYLSPSPAAAAVPLSGDSFRSQASSLSQAEPEGETEKWRSRKKHVFILNASGRPVFSRWGDESTFSELFGVLQLLASIAAVVPENRISPAMISSPVNPKPTSRARSTSITSSSSTYGLRSISCSGCIKVHFFQQQELIYVMVTKTGEDSANCIQQLQLLHMHFLSVLPTVNKVLIEHPTYDVRRYFAQPDVNSMRSLIRKLGNSPSYYFRALQATRVPLVFRSDINEILLSCKGGEEHLYTFLLYEDQVVSCVSPRSHALHVDDILVLLNYTSCVVVSQGQAWVPICLPKFNDSGYMWCYVVRVSDLATDATTQRNGDGGQSPLLLVQLATAQDQFSLLSDAAISASTMLSNAGLLLDIDQLARDTALPIDTAYCGPGGADLQFYMFITGNSQLICSQYPPQMANSKAERKRVFRLLIKLRAQVQQGSNAKDPLLCYSTPRENVLVSLAPTVNGVNSGCSGPTIAGASRPGSLYMLFLPCASYSTMTDCADRLIRWLKSKDEDMFITRAPHW